MGKRRFHRWLKRRSKLRAARRRQNLRSQRPARLMYERLEDRVLLSTVIVDTVTDVDDGDTSSIAALIATPGADTVISLREAIIAANADSVLTQPLLVY